MIVCNLAVLLAERNKKMSDVINDTKLAKNTVRSLFYNNAKGIQFDTLETICEYLNVTPNELIVYSPLKYFLSNSGYDEKLVYFDIELSPKKGKIIKGEIDAYYELTEFQWDGSPALRASIEIYYSPKIFEEIKQIPRIFYQIIEDEIVQEVIDSIDSPLLFERLDVSIEVIDYRQTEESST